MHFVVHTANFLYLPDHYCPLVSWPSTANGKVKKIIGTKSIFLTNWDQFCPLTFHEDDFERNMSFVSEPAYPGVRGRAVALKRQQMGGHWNTFAPSASSSCTSPWQYFGKKTLFKMLCLDWNVWFENIEKLAKIVWEMWKLLWWGAAPAPPTKSDWMGPEFMEGDKAVSTDLSLHPNIAS